MKNTPLMFPPVQQRGPRDDDEPYAVSMLLEHRDMDRNGQPHRQYLVRWDGHDESADTWVWENDVTVAALREYWKTTPSTMPLRVEGMDGALTPVKEGDATRIEDVDDDDLDEASVDSREDSSDDSDVDWTVGTEEESDDDSDMEWSDETDTDSERKRPEKAGGERKRPEKRRKLCMLTVATVKVEYAKRYYEVTKARAEAAAADAEAARADVDAAEAELAAVIQARHADRARVPAQ